MSQYNEIIRKGHKVFLQSESGMYGAKIVGIAVNHYRVQTYYATGLPYRHNVTKSAVSLQDGQY